MNVLRFGFCGLLILATTEMALRADGDGLPGGAFKASRYQALWENSPFAVASPVAVESVEYSLVGVAEFDGISYASVIDRQSQEHFVVTSQMPSHGMSLVSLVHGSTPGSTYATLQKSEGMLKLTLDTTSMPSAAPLPGVLPEASTMPRVNMMPPTFQRRPNHVRIYYPTIHVPRPPTASP